MITIKADERFLIRYFESLGFLTEQEQFIYDLIKAKSSEVAKEEEDA